MAQKNKENFSPYKKKNQGKLQSRSRGHLKPDKIYTAAEANDRLFDIFKNHEFSHITHEQRALMSRYYELLMEEQKVLNFTRILDFKDIAIKQFIDCAIVARLYPLSFPLMDVGTGPGLPGIILKILYPEQQIFLAEGVQKRVEFLKRVRRDMKLKNLGIFGRNINPSFVYPVQGVITRAVEDIGNTLSNVRHSVQAGGRVFFMKGPNVDEELALAMKDLDPMWKLEKDIAYSLPKTSHDRRLLVFKKVQAAPLLTMQELMDIDYEFEEEET